MLRKPHVTDSQSACFSFSTANYSRKLHIKHSCTKGCSTQNQTISLSIASLDCWVHVSLSYPPDTKVTSKAIWVTPSPNMCMLQCFMCLNVSEHTLTLYLTRTTSDLLTVTTHSLTCTGQSQLPADDFSIPEVPKVIAHCAPGVVEAHLHSSL